MDCGNGSIVVAEFFGATFLSAVGSGALHVTEDHVKDVDHIVASAAGEQMGVGGQSGDPPHRSIHEQEHPPTVRRPNLHPSATMIVDVGSIHKASASTDI